MRVRWLITGLVILIIAVFAVPATAGVLTTSTYTYVFKGQELALPVDILTVQGHHLAPLELLETFNPRLSMDGDAISLTRGPVTVNMVLGSDTAWVDGKPRPLRTAPVKIAGRLFVPVEILPDLGASVTVDGKFVLMSDYNTQSEADAGQVDLTELHRQRTVKENIRDSNTFMSLSITALNADLLSDPESGIPWGTRLRLQSMLGTRLLLLVQVQNHSLRSATLDPTKLMLIGQNGRQYDYLKSEIAIDGTVTGPIAPGATRTAVLVYPPVAEAAFDVYYDGSMTVLGRLPNR